MENVSPKSIKLLSLDADFHRGKIMRRNFSIILLIGIATQVLLALPLHLWAPFNFTGNLSLPLSLLFLVVNTLLLSIFIFYRPLKTKWALFAVALFSGLVMALMAEGDLGAIANSPQFWLLLAYPGISMLAAVLMQARYKRQKKGQKPASAIKLDEHNLSLEEMEEQYEKNISPREREFRKRLHGLGYRYNLHGKYQNKRLPGLPTLVLPRYHSVIFVLNCVKHGHAGCREINLNEQSRDFLEKVYQVKYCHDLEYRKLRGKNWKVIELWECTLHPDQFESTLQRIAKELDQALQRHTAAV